jgi:maltose-binding protein MalE
MLKIGELTLKKQKLYFGLVLGVFISASLSFSIANAAPESEEQLPDFEIVVPWGLDQPRGQIIKSMIDNSSIAGKYNYIYTAVGGSPSDRDGLVSRFLAGDYPNLLLVTQDWYTEFAGYGIWYDFSANISSWSGNRAGWRTDIPAGWWSILDKANGDGTGTNIFALPFFGQTILPYVNLDNLTTAGLTEADFNDTLAKFMSSSKTLKDNGITAFAEIGQQISDLAYMNYMMGSTNNYINASANPATVFSWDTNDDYGVNGTLSVEGLAAWLKMKGEGYAQSTVDTTGGGDANSIFGLGQAASVFCGPWGTSIFMDAGLSATSFKAIAMPKTSDGVRSTVTGGGISMVPKAPLQSSTLQSDASLLAQWLLEDENQMKTVDNWLNTSWRIPVRESLKNNAWFTAAGHPERANFIIHIESQSYAFPWGRQHPKWLDIHEAVMMPGYRNAMLKVQYGKGYTDAEYKSMAQSALNKMAADIQCFYLGGPCVTITSPPSVVTYTSGGSTIISTIQQTTTKSGSTPGFELFVAIPIILGMAGMHLLRRRRK